jgi:hypothetical protein
VTDPVDTAVFTSQDTVSDSPLHLALRHAGVEKLRTSDDSMGALSDPCDRVPGRLRRFATHTVGK